MKHRVILAGLAGTMLVAGFAGSALAQAYANGRYYPDGTNCSLLSDQEIVGCQNQIYARQLRSGESDMATGPNDQTLILGSSPADAAESASTIVPGAETDAPLDSTLPRPEGAEIGTGEPTRLPGAEGTLGGADNGGYATPQ
jgi:hypothetical protein